MAYCKKCLIPNNVPGADLNSQGIGKFCREYNEKQMQTNDYSRKKYEEDLEQAIQECRGKGEYDCLVPLSGGKDSIYLLYKLKFKYNLKILAFTTNVNIPDIAWKNINNCIKRLDIDHITYTPSFTFYTKLFQHLLKNQEKRGAVYTISYVYAPLFEGDAIKLAIQKEIPLILAGYSPGQPEPERMLYEFSPKLIRETDWTPPALRQSNRFNEAELALFYNPQNYPSDTRFPRYLAPFHAWEYNQQTIINEVAGRGLVAAKSHANPILTNYPINWLLMYSDLKHFGYNPYHPEFSALIREGKASKTYWRIMTPIVNGMIRHKILLGNEVQKAMKWLDLKDDDLRINMPYGAYDPPLNDQPH